MTQLRSGLALLGCVLLLVSAGCLSLSDDSLEDEVEDRIEAAEPPETVAGEQHINERIQACLERAPSAGATGDSA